MAITFSSIEITFEDNLLVGDYIKFDIEVDGSLSGQSKIENWVSLRQNSYQVSVTPYSGNGLGSAENYENAFWIDYSNSGNLFLVSRIGETVRIVSTVIGLNFLNAESSSINVFFNIDNAIAASNYSLVDINYAAGASCQYINIAVVTNQSTDYYTVNGGAQVSVNSASFNFDYLRGEIVTLRFYNVLGDFISILRTLPKELKAVNLQVSVVGTPSGATATAALSGLLLSQTLEYSINGTVYQPENYFTGLGVNSYIMYVRGVYGCVIQKSFEVVEFTGNLLELVPEFSISKSNSIRYKRDEEWDYDSIYKSDENTLSFEENVRLPICGYRQKFQTNDSITTQFRTNYSDVSAFIHNGTSEIPIAVIQKSDNIQRKDARQGNIYAVSSTEVGIYFTSGDTYDYDTLVPNGTYELNGQLPPWASIGAWVNIATIGWLQIANIIRKDDDSAWVAVFAYNAIYAPSIQIVSTIYDARNFEVYEFDIDFNAYPNLDVQVKILATDVNFGTIQYLSEIINVRERHEGTVVIKYSNTQNTSKMNYSYGISNLIRVTGDIGKYKPDGEITVHRADTKTVFIEASAYEDFEINIHAEPTAMARKVAIALIHDTLEIDGVKYLSKEVPEVESLGDDSNLYSIVGKVTKSEEVFVEDTSPELTQSELIGLLEDNGEYFKIN